MKQRCLLVKQSLLSAPLSIANLDKVGLTSPLYIPFAAPIRRIDALLRSVGIKQAWTDESALELILIGLENYKACVAVSRRLHIHDA